MACALALTHGPRIAVPASTAQTGSSAFASAIRAVLRILTTPTKVRDRPDPPPPSFSAERMSGLHGVWGPLSRDRQGARSPRR